MIGAFLSHTRSWNANAAVIATELFLRRGGAASRDFILSALESTKDNILDRRAQSFIKCSNGRNND